MRNVTFKWIYSPAGRQVVENLLPLVSGSAIMFLVITYQAIVRCVLPSFLVVVVLTAPGCFCFITFLQILPGWPVFRTITLFFTFTCNITSHQGKSNLIGLDFTSPGRHSSHFCRVETLWVSSVPFARADCFKWEIIWKMDKTKIHYLLNTKNLDHT